MQIIYVADAGHMDMCYLSLLLSFYGRTKKAKKDLLTCLRHTYDYFDTDPGQDDAIYADGQPDFVSVRQRCFRSN